MSVKLEMDRPLYVTALPEVLTLATRHAKYVRVGSEIVFGPSYMAHEDIAGKQLHFTHYGHVHDAGFVEYKALRNRIIFYGISAGIDIATASDAPLRFPTDSNPKSWSIYDAQMAKVKNDTCVLFLRSTAQLSQPPEVWYTVQNNADMGIVRVR